MLKPKERLSYELRIMLDRVLSESDSLCVLTAYADMDPLEPDRVEEIVVDGSGRHDVLALMSGYIFGHVIQMLQIDERITDTERKEALTKIWGYLFAGVDCIAEGAMSRKFVELLDNPAAYVDLQLDAVGSSDANPHLVNVVERIVRNALVPDKDAKAIRLRGEDCPKQPGRYGWKPWARLVTGY